MERGAVSGSQAEFGGRRSRAQAALLFYGRQSHRPTISLTQKNAKKRKNFAACRPRAGAVNSFAFSARLRYKFRQYFLEARRNIE